MADNAGSDPSDDESDPSDYESDIFSDDDSDTSESDDDFDPSELFLCVGGGSVPRNVRRVEVDRSVTLIPDDLFMGCSQLESVLLHEGLLGIGKYAFLGCSSLRIIQFPATVTNIGAGAFRGCSNLAAIELPEGLQSIEDYAFCGCTSLEEVRIPASVTQICKGAFAGCKNLASVDLREGLWMIGDRAFGDCWSLGSLRIPSSIDDIGGYAFDDCSNLTLVLLHDGLSSVKRFAFRGCPAKSIRFVRLSQRMAAMRMDDQMTSMFESRLNEISNAMTSDYDDMEAAGTIWGKCKKSLERAHKVLTYLELNRSMPVLELALWKGMIEDEREERLRGSLADNEDGGQDARDAGRARQQGPQLSREECRVKCGAGIVSAEVRKFFAYSMSWPGLDVPE